MIYFSYSFKGVQTQAIDPKTENLMRLFNPRQDNWFEHFVWDEEGIRIIGITAMGRATVQALKLNNE